MELLLEAGDRLTEGPELQGRQAVGRQDRLGLGGQLLPAREIPAVAHIHVGHQPMGGFTGQHSQPLQPLRCCR